jgi:hypothetical protein
MLHPEDPRPGLVVLRNALGVHSNFSAGKIASDLLIFNFPLKELITEDADAIFLLEFIDE